MVPWLNVQALIGFVLNNTVTIVSKTGKRFNRSIQQVHNREAGDSVCSGK
jgi:hypothetical protein